MHIRERVGEVAMGKASRARRRLLERMVSLLSREAEPSAPGLRADSDDVPEELVALLESAFEVVPSFMQDTIHAA